MERRATDVKITCAAFNPPSGYKNNKDSKIRGSVLGSLRLTATTNFFNSSITFGSLTLHQHHLYHRLPLFQTILSRPENRAK
jgi:hypothetical protein